MRNALIISKEKELGDALSKVIRPLRLDRIEVTDSAQEARRRIQELAYNLIIINAPLTHELGTELALDILEMEDSDIVMIVKSEDLANVEMKLYNSPIFIEEKPLNKQKFIRDLNYILNCQNRRERFNKQYRKLKNNMDSLKLQFRAKILLMKNLDMTEDQAHRYLQKQSMDNRKTPGQVAQSIINLYDKK